MLGNIQLQMKGLTIMFATLEQLEKWLNKQYTECGSNESFKEFLNDYFSLHIIIVENKLISSEYCYNLIVHEETYK